MLAQEKIAACCDCPEHPHHPSAPWGPRTPSPLRLPALLLPLGQDALVLGVQLGHMAGHAAKETGQGSGGSASATKAVPREETLPPQLLGRAPPVPRMQPTRCPAT